MMRFVQWLKRKAGFVRAVIRLLYGIVGYLFFHKNFESSYQSLIKLYCDTSGKSRDVLAWIVTMVSPFKANFTSSKIFPGLSDSDINSIVSEIREKGYHVHTAKLPVDFYREIKEFALRNPATVRILDEGSKEVDIVFDSKSVLGVRYDFKSDDLINLNQVQELVSDPFFVEVAGRYLGSRPYLDLVAMWWTAKYKDLADVNAAQLYHFDMDRIKWLKVFVYLSDVTEENGPHYFVEGSHKSGQIPPAILKQGYARISDDEVVSLMGEDRVRKVTGPVGTFFFEDTSGLHKGEVVRGEPRLAFEFQYSNSLFGPPVKINVQEPRVMTSQFREARFKFNWCK